MSDESFDFVVVGSGSAGSVIAGRLAEQTGGSIAVIEAGKKRWPKISKLPIANARAIGRPAHDWCYVSQPDPTRLDRVELWPRGKGLGGSSLINGMIYVRGNRADYDAWAALGNPGWDHAGVLPSFMRMETSEVQGQGRGQFGPQPVSMPRYLHPLTDKVIEAAGRNGLPFNRDINGADQTGIGYNQATQRNGRRASAYDSFLEQHVRSGRVTLFDDAQVKRILVENNSAVGVAVAKDGTERIVRGGKIILAAGAVNTPHLLMLSGIGPASEIEAHGIPLVYDAPEVGKNMLEHVGLWMPVEVDMPTLNQLQNPLRFTAAMVKWLFGRGPATNSTGQAIGFSNEKDALGRPRLQFHFAAFGLSTEKTGPKVPNRRLVSLMPSVNHPESKGELTLASADPFDPPRIAPRLLEARSDLELLGKGVRFCEQLLQTDPLKRHVKGLVVEPPAEGPAFENYLREYSLPLYHIVGTCRMGSDSASVVDPRLQVRGVGNLMIADASIMPAHVSGNTQAASMMIGEKAAEFILSNDDVARAPAAGFQVKSHG